VREVAQISDRDWLATPGVGQAALKEIRNITHPPQQEYDPDIARLTDAELLQRLEVFINELRWIQRILKAKLSGPPGGEDSLRSQGRGGSGPDEKLPVQ
jgi:hypothetical protein